MQVNFFLSFGHFRLSICKEHLGQTGRQTDFRNFPSYAATLYVKNFPGRIVADPNYSMAVSGNETDRQGRDENIGKRPHLPETLLRAL